MSDHETLTPSQREMVSVWEQHMSSEFVTKDTEATLDTMVPDAYVNHVPVMTGGVGLDAARAFYSEHFITKMPPDTETVLVSRTVGVDQIVDELIFKFTHTETMDWMLPRIEPTGRRVEVPLVAIIGFKDGKVAHEHIYWDQASVLAQIGLLDGDTLPIVGAESALKVLDPTRPSNELMR